MTADHITGTQFQHQTGIMELKGIYCSVLLALCLLSARSNGQMDQSFLDRFPPCQRLTYCFYNGQIMSMYNKLMQFQLHSVIGDIDGLCAHNQRDCQKEACQNSEIVEAVEGVQDMIEVLCVNKPVLVQGSHCWQQVGRLMRPCLNRSRLSDNREKFNHCIQTIFSSSRDSCSSDEEDLYTSLYELLATRTGAGL